LLRKGFLMGTQASSLSVDHPRRSSLLAAILGVAIVAAACAADPAVKKQHYLESGNQFFDKGQYAEAIVEYRNAIDIDATFGPARKRLAESYARTGNDRGAFGEFIRAADLLPTDVAVQLNAGNLLLAARKPEEALARAEAALKVQPQNIDALVLRGNALSGLSSFDEALKAIEQAIQLDRDRGATYTDLGSVELAHGRREQAEAAFLRAVELSPKETRSHLGLANFYWSSGRMNEAERAFEEALKFDSTNVQANRFMASFKISAGRRAEAEPYLRRIADSSQGPEGTLSLADYYLLTGRPKDAIATIEGLKSAKDVPVVMILLARAHAAAGERNKAHSLVDQVLGTNQKDAAAHLLKGQLLLQEGRGQEALSAVQTAVAIAPASVDAQYALGRLYASRGDRAAAETAFKEVLRINPRATAARVQLAALQAPSSPQDSVRTAEEATRNDPTNLTARLTLVRSLTSAKDVARAEREMTKLRAEYPNVAAVHSLDATLGMLKKDMAGARASIERAEKLDPASIDTFRVSIAFELMQNNSTAAKARLEERLKQGTNPDVLIFAGNTYLSLKDPGAAEKMMRAAIEADPSRSEPYATLGSIYLNEKRLDEALREFEALSKRQAKPIDPLTMTGVILEQQGKVDAAMKRYDEVLTLDSRAGTAANNLAWILADRGQDLDRALQLAQTAIAVAPEVPQVLDTLGWVYYKRNQPLQAIPLFERCVQKAPGIAEYHYHLGLALLKTRDNAKGRSALQRALDSKPDAAVSAEIHRALESAN
jgi:tetratricopeptide (TPR) repeat protein